MAKRVLVTGASGFIGRHVISPLVAQGYEVHGCYHMQSSNLDLDESRLCTWHQADLLANDTAAKLMSEISPTHLLHLAWYTEHGKYWSSPKNVDWVTASLRLIQEFTRSEGSRAVIAGTCAEYDWHYGFCNEEITPLKPKSLYGVSKHALQIIADTFAHESGLSVAWGRVFFPFGPGENQHRLIPSVILSLLNNEPAVCTHGEQIRDFMYVEDVADAFVALLDSDIRGPINIGSGNPMAIKNLVIALADYVGQQKLVQLNTLPAQTGESSMVVADTTNLRVKLGWSPKHSMESAIEKSFAWWKMRAGEKLSAAKAKQEINQG